MFSEVTVERMNEHFIENMTVNLVFLRDQRQARRKKETEQEVLGLDD